MFHKENFELFLEENEYIDYRHPLIQEKIKELFHESMNEIEKAEAAYLYVRDEIPHSYDIMAKTVNAKASDVLKNHTGVCHAKSNLLAALLRSQGIPTGFCFERLTLANDESKGYCIHGYNAVYLSNHWVKLDARGNKPGVQAEFSLTNPILAFPPRKQYNEYYIDGIFAHPRPESMAVLEQSKTIQEVLDTCTDLHTQKPDIPEITVRPFAAEDVKLFSDWLDLPHIQKYYHDPLDWIDEVEKRDTEFSWITQMIVMLEQKPIGFCQYYDYRKSIPYGENWQGTIPTENTYSLDYMIADTDYLGKGYGRQTALKLIQLIQMEPDAKRIIVQPEKENLPSCSTLLSSGFIYDAQNELYLMELSC